MKSHTTERFRRAFATLPRNVQEQARQAYRLFQQNPHHPSLHFRQVHPSLPIYSARINLDYRALGTREDQAIVWFWIGSHGEYDHLLSRAG
jgi:hypothetical protein